HPRRGDGRFDLLELELRIEAGAHALARQALDRLAVGELPAGKVELIVGARELHVHASNRRGEHEAGGEPFGVRGARAPEGRVVSRAVLAPEIELVAEAQGELCGREARAADRRRKDVVLGETLASRIDAGPKLRAERRASDLRR